MRSIWSTVTDWFFTLSGIVLLVGGGFGATYVAGMPPFASGWLAESEALFLLSGLIWLLVLVPIQIRQARQARAFAGGGAIPDAYWRNSRLWLVWGIVATVPLVAAHIPDGRKTLGRAQKAEVGGILLPGAPLTALVTAYAAIASASKLSLALVM